MASTKINTRPGRPFAAGDPRTIEAGRKGGSRTGSAKARDMKGKTRVKPKATSGIKEGKEW